MNNSKDDVVKKIIIAGNNQQQPAIMDTAGEQCIIRLCCFHDI